MAWFVKNWQVCLKHKVDRPEPLSPTPLQELPWQELGMEFFQCQSLYYLIFIDYYLRFIEIAAMTKKKENVKLFDALKEYLSVMESLKRLDLTIVLLLILLNMLNFQMIGDS